MSLTIDEVLAELDRAGVTYEHRPGENGVLAFCVVCGDEMAWTETWQRWICNNPSCVSQEYPSAIGNELYFRSSHTWNTSNGNGHHEREVVADSRESATSPRATVDRYAGRFYDLEDLDALLAKPSKPTPWRVHDLVADGTLTIVSGESGSGKSWLAQALCTGVARGKTVAGVLCRKGNALYVDSEMGRDMFVDQRLRSAGITTAEFRYIEALGLDVSKPDDLGWVQERIGQVAANFVVIDSLRRLVPSKAENDSDDMAPTVAALAKLARDTGAAILLIHHKGDSEKFFRGSSAIKDQADALFALLRDPDDEDAPRRLRCRGGRGKMRYAPEPPDVYLSIEPEAGGVAAADKPEDGGPQVPVRESVAVAIKAAMPAKTKKEVAEKVGRSRDDWAFRGAWEDLERAGGIVQINGGWVAGGGGLPLETTTTSRIEATGSVSGIEAGASIA